jgi:DNA-binding GntR family transcriptional regulator
MESKTTDPSQPDSPAAPSTGNEPQPSGRGSVQDRVLASLRYGLMSGLFVPGQVVSLRKLAESLGTSPMPVRESLSRLVAANALEELPNRSVRVPRLSAKGLVELFEVRTLIEGMAARIACEQVTESLIDELAAINGALIAAHRKRDMAAVLVQNQKFHFRVYKAANSDILMPLIESLWLRCGPTMFHSFVAPKDLWDTSQHLALLDAFRRRDRQAAQKAMVADIRKSGDYLVSEAASKPLSGPMAQLSNIFE